MENPREQTHPRECEVFLTAAEITDKAKLAAFIDEACGDDDHLRSRVAVLLKHEKESEGDTMLQPADSRIADAIRDYKSGAPTRMNSDAARPSSPSAPGRWIPPSSAQLNGLIAGFEVADMIGRGGMGAVYRGEQTSLQRPVAIKILPPEFGDEEEFSERFRREALAMAKMDHPNIVTIFDFGSVSYGAQEDFSSPPGQLFYFVMEFIDGTDLQQLIRSGDLSAEAALNLISQICDALQYAHGEGYVHRDIKPANIFVTAGGVVKVGDFGLAKLTGLSEEDSGNLTLTGHVVGTPHYLAPETLEGDGNVDHRADIFSLGVMFYQMLTGSIPKGAFQPPSKKVQIDVRLDEIVLKAMHAEPELRYQHVSEVKDDVTIVTSTQSDIDELKARIPTPKPASEPTTNKEKQREKGTPNPTANTNPKKKRSPILLIFTVVAALAAGGFGIKYLLDQNPEPSPGVEVAVADLPETTPPEIGGAETAPLPEQTPPTQITGDFPSLKFDGLDEKVVIESLPFRTIAKRSFTIETWYKSEDRNGILVGFIHFGMIQASAGDRGREMNFRYPNGFLTADQTWEQTNEWTHFAAVCDFEKGENRFYRNGQLTESKPLAEKQKIAAGEGGDALQLGGFQLDGWLGETQVSSVARYDKDFTPSRDHQPDEDTVALYKMTGSESGVLKDFSGNGHDGKISEPLVKVAREVPPIAPAATLKAPLPIPTRDIPDLSKLPTGKIRFLGEKVDPSNVQNAEFLEETEFVEVQIDGNAGWFALRENGDVVRYKGEDIDPAYRSNVAVMNRCGDGHWGNWISKTGGFINRSHTPWENEERFPESHLVDFAHPYQSNHFYFVGNDGKARIIQPDRGDTEIEVFKDFVRVEFNHRSVAGLRANGQLVHLGGETQVDYSNVSDIKIAKLEASEFHLVALDLKGKIWISDANSNYSMRPFDELNLEGPFQDIACNHHVVAARRLDGRWFANSTDGGNADFLREFNELAPNSPSLDIRSNAAVWIESAGSDTEHSALFPLPIPTRDLPELATLPQGKLRFLGDEKVMQWAERPGTANKSDFVQVFGWLGLDASGNAISLDDGQTRPNTEGRVSQLMRRAYGISKSGGIVSLGEAAPWPQEAEIPKSDIVDFVSSYHGELFFLKKDGTLLQISSAGKITKLPNTDCVQIAELRESVVGIRTSGQLIHVGGAEFDHSKVSDVKFVKMMSPGEFLMALDDTGRVWKSEHDRGGNYERMVLLENLNKHGPMIDIACSNQTGAGRRADGRWVAVSFSVEHPYVEEFNRIAPNTDSLDLQGKGALGIGAVWIESSPTPESAAKFPLPIPTRDFTDPKTLPAGKIHVWGNAAAGTPMKTDQFEDEKFVEVLLKDEGGWAGLTQNGNVIILDPREGIKAQHLDQQIRNIRRTASQHVGEWLTESGKIKDRSHHIPHYVDAFGHLELRDFAMGDGDLNTKLTAGLQTNGSVVFQGINRPAPSPHSDFVRIEGTHKSIYGIRENGNIECWGPVPSGFEEMKKHRFVKLSGDGQYLLALTGDGQIWRADAQNAYPVRKLPKGTGPVIDIANGFRAHAARRVSDRRWVVWNEGEAPSEEMKQLIKKVATLGPNVESLSVNGYTPALIWIETD